MVEKPPHPPASSSVAGLERPASRARFLVVALVLLAIATAIFSPFLFGERVMLYKGIGSDSLNDDYPIFVHLSEHVRSGNLPFWSFHLGMGQSLYPSVTQLLLNPVVWLPKEMIAEAIAWQHILKLLIVGLLFFRFLELRGLIFRSALGGGALLACSTYMCFGGCWSVAANEVIGFTFLLFAIESALVRGRWAYLPCAVALLGFITVFHLYLGALLLSLYVPVRLVALHGWQPRLVWRIAFPLAGAAVLGCGLAAIVTIDNAAAILNSPRGPATASASLAGKPIFGLESGLHYLTAILRRFSADMLGTGIDFRGWYNYFEAPANYCGLVSLLLLPQAFVQTTLRQRILHALFLGYLIVPVLFPWFRYLFWAFQGDYYRVYSLFGVLGMLTLATLALSRYVERRSLNPWVLGVTLAGLLVVLWLPLDTLQSLVVPELRYVASAILLTHAALLFAGHRLQRHSLFAWLVLGVSGASMIYLDRITVADRDTVMKSELRARSGYNDHTVEAVRDVQAADAGFYRISKLYSSSPAIHASLNDAMIFGFFGTSSYSSFNNLDYIRFLVATDVLPPNPTEFNTRWAKGLSERPLLAAFANEKYIITQDPQPLHGDPNVRFLATHGEVHVFRSARFVPFGLPFRHYIRQSDFAKWPASAKEHALFYGVVVADEALAASRPLARASLTRLDLDRFTQLVNREPLPAVISSHNQHALQLHHFSHNRIVGRIELAHEAIVVFQMPFDPGWKAFIDGKRSPPLKVDAGLTGLHVAAGAHEIALKFVPRFLPIGAVATLLSVVVFVFALRRWPRVNQKPAAAPAVGLTIPTPVTLER